MNPKPRKYMYNSNTKYKAKSNSNTTFNTFYAYCTTQTPSHSQRAPLADHAPRISSALAVAGCTRPKRSVCSPTMPLSIFSASWTFSSPGRRGGGRQSRLESNAADIHLYSAPQPPRRHTKQWFPQRRVAPGRWRHSPCLGTHYSVSFPSRPNPRGQGSQINTQKKVRVGRFF